jgi:diguanylate cyclase (GGDEF)-like protein/PAS domain S-box-containing protein
LSSLRNRWMQRFRVRLPGSIVARTTLSILILSMTMGLIFATIEAANVDRREQQRAEIRLQQLLSTVESTVQIACYLKDRTLAVQISQGLIRNRAVAGVNITSGNATLYQIGRAPTGQRRGLGSPLITRRIYSPFDASESVGEISLFVARAEIDADAASYSRAATLAMGLQVMLIAAGVAVAVYFFGTRPIKAVSNELHRIRFDTGMLLNVSSLHRYDEVGSLVTDVNALIARQAGLLETERELRIEREVGERKMRLIFEKAETGLFVLDAGGILESWNPAFIRILRLTAEQLPQSGVTQLQQLLGLHAARVSDLIHQCLATGQSNELDLEITTDGNPRAGWIEVSVNPIGPNSLQGVVNDITERKLGELSAQQLAMHDTLTGLLNRRGLQTGLDAALALRSPESSPELALLQIDLDYFKEVNDAYGHEGGDRVLQYVAKVLQRNARRGDLIARPGGDEFVVALVGITNPPKAEQIAQAIIGEIKQPIDVGGGHSVLISASIGVAFAAKSQDSPDALMSRADAAMYKAKQAGRGQACLAPESTALHTSAAA